MTKPCLSWRGNWNSKLILLSLVPGWQAIWQLKFKSIKSFYLSAIIFVFQYLLFVWASIEQDQTGTTQNHPGFRQHKRCFYNSVMGLNNSAINRLILYTQWPTPIPIPIFTIHIKDTKACDRILLEKDLATHVIGSKAWFKISNHAKISVCDQNNTISVPYHTVPIQFDTF